MSKVAVRHRDRLGAVEIVTVDSPKAAVLRKRAKPVGRVTAEMQRLIHRMINVMREAKGVGLAAPQIGVSKRVFVAEVEERIHVFIDPQIVKKDGEEVSSEGCLSIPGVVADVPRALQVTVKGKNRKGRGITVSAEGLLARVIQHEVDHLNGVLFLDRVVDRSTIREVTASTEVEAATPSA